MNPGPFLLLPKFLFYAIIHNKSIRISEVETEMDEQGGLFERTAYQPLAERVRPQSLEEFVGQEHLLGSGKVLRRLIESDHITSMIFWGPPGVGKTTLAQIIAAQTKAKFITFSAVTSGIKDIRTVMQEADRRQRDQPQGAHEEHEEEEDLEDVDGRPPRRLVPVFQIDRGHEGVSRFDQLGRTLVALLGDLDPPRPGQAVQALVDVFANARTRGRRRARGEVPGARPPLAVRSAHESEPDERVGGAAHQSGRRPRRARPPDGMRRPAPTLGRAAGPFPS